MSLLFQTDPFISDIKEKPSLFSAETVVVKMQHWKAPPLPFCPQPTLLPGLFALIRRCDSYLSSRITVTERDGHCGQSWRAQLRLEGNTIHASSAVNPPSAISSGMRGGVIRETGVGKMRRKNKGGAGQEVKRGGGGASEALHSSATVTSCRGRPMLFIQTPIFREIRECISPKTLSIHIPAYTQFA